jgi:hypothetical protein
MFGRGDRLPYQRLVVLIWSSLKKKEETDKFMHHGADHILESVFCSCRIGLVGVERFGPALNLSRRSRTVCNNRPGISRSIQRPNEILS